MIVISKYLVPKGYRGITIYPFIIVRSNHLSHDDILLNHEKIHIRQQLEMGVLLFYIAYTFEFLIKLLVYGSGQLAYRNISFEREAYANEMHLDYLDKRAFWRFLKYLRRNDF